MFNDAECAGFTPLLCFAHVSIVIAQAGEPLDALADGAFAKAFLVVCGELLEDDEEELFRGGSAEEALGGLEQIQCDGIAGGRKEFVGALGKPVELEGAAAQLRFSPGIEKAGLLHLVAEFLDAHVGHIQAVGEVADGEALGALEFIENLQARTTSDGLEQALFHRRMEGGDSAGTQFHFKAHPDFNTRMMEKSKDGRPGGAPVFELPLDATSGKTGKALGVRLRLAQAKGAIAGLELAALLEQLDALETLEDIALHGDGAASFETTMLRHDRMMAWSENSTASLGKRGAEASAQLQSRKRYSPRVSDPPEAAGTFLNFDCLPGGEL
jgi:hypothetical protein